MRFQWKVSRRFSRLDIDRKRPLQLPSKHRRWGFKKNTIESFVNFLRQGNVFCTNYKRVRCQRKLNLPWCKNYDLRLLGYYSVTIQLSMCRYNTGLFLEKEKSYECRFRCSFSERQLKVLDKTPTGIFLGMRDQKWLPFLGFQFQNLKSSISPLLPTCQQSIKGKYLGGEKTNIVCEKRLFILVALVRLLCE